MTSFDLLFWLLIIMLAVVAYAIEAGIATRHRTAVLGTMFSVIGAVTYILVIGEDNAFGRGSSSPDLTISAPALPKLPDKLGELADLRVPEALKKKPVVKASEKSIPSGPFADCEGCPSMIAVRPGTFIMGSPETEPGRRNTEGPIGVHIEYPFAVGRYEVTRDQFVAFVEDARYLPGKGCLVKGRFSSAASWQQPGFEQAGNHPVACVTWSDARAYTAWLSKKTKKAYRLLSEAEWEFAARGGTQTIFAYGDNFSASLGNLGRSRDGTIPVGFSTANEFGLHDVHGNVWEILDDCWHEDLGLNSGNGKANVLRANCSQRIIRGGGWDSTPQQARLAARGVIETNAAANTVGFRIARNFE